jgi:CRISPR-associated endoribonuclease Cas6
MRIKIQLKNLGDVTATLPINNQHLLTGYFHKCLGINNEYHDGIYNNYSLSTLRGGRMNEDKETVSFEKGAHFFVSSMDSEFIDKISIGVFSNPNFGHGLKFKSIDSIEEQFYNGYNHFKTLSPILFKKDNSFINVDDDQYESKLQKYIKYKLSKIDSSLNLSDFKISVTKHKSNKIKLIDYKGIKNKASLFQFTLFTNKKVAKTLYNYGVGKSTGCGFGTIYKTENHQYYKDY